MAGAMKRKDVLPERIWATEDILSEKDIDNIISDIEDGCKRVEAFRGNLNKENALEVFLLHSRISLLYEKLDVYCSLRWDEDKSNTKYAALSERIQILGSNTETKLAFFMPALSTFKNEDLLEMRDNPEYSYFSMILTEIIRNKKHFLSAKEETLLANMSSFIGDFQKIFMIFDNVNIPFGNICVDGEEVKFGHGLYSVLLQNQDRALRKEAYEKMFTPYKSMIDTISAVYAGNVKKDVFFAKMRKYKSCLELKLYSDNIPVKVYENLIASVRKGMPNLHKYMEYRCKEMKLSKLTMYDLHVSIVEGIEKKYEYDGAYELVCEALQPLGEEYVQTLRRAKKERWLDVEETENKRSGAYCCDLYGLHPFVLLNHKDTIHDVFTIAHEMGHAMHTYYSNAAQCYEKASYSIFVAEIASTVNEVLLIKHLLKTATGKERKYLLSYYIDMFRTTLFRQTMFSEFEKFAHETVENGKPLTYETMNTFYADLNRTYYGEHVETDDLIACEWARIPHFYHSYYVYKYATGLTCAVNIANKILTEEGAVEKYKKFLSSGGSMYPLDEIKLVDIDLTKREPFDYAMKEFSLALKELRSTK